MSPLALVLDTDIGTDVDDAFALAYAVRHPELELRAVTTVSGDVRRRAVIAATLLALAGRGDVEVAAGLAAPAPAGRAVELGHEGDGLLDRGGPAPVLSPRDAVEVLLDTAGPGAASVAAVGMQTNLAAAAAADTGWAGRVPRVAVMGGVFAPHPAFTPADDHNLNADPPGAVGALNAGLPLLYVPGNVTVTTFLSEHHLRRLRRGDPLCRALADLTDRWTPLLRARGRGVHRDQVAALHDPLTVACLVDRRFVDTRAAGVTAALHDGVVRTFVDPVGGHPAEIVTRVDAAGFAAHWLDIVLG